MKLETIVIKTKNLDRVKQFYQNKLELPVVDNEEKSVNVKVGSSILTFIEDENRTEAIYHLAFNIPGNRLQEAINWSHDRIELIKKESVVLIAEFETWNANSVYFFDVDGNLLELIARYDLENSTIKRFNSSQILNVSEIGIVVSEPSKYGKQLMDEYGLSLFEKNQNSEVFTAIGDDNGLLIIVKANRNWYPTEIPAKSNWTQIKLKEGEKEFKIDRPG